MRNTSKITCLLLIATLLIGCKKQQAKLHYNKAYDLEEEDKYAEAIIELDKAIQLNPQFEEAYLNRAIDKSVLEDYQGAIADLDLLIQLNPDVIEPHLCRAEYNRMLEKYPEANIDAQRAFKLYDDKNTVSLDNLDSLLPNKKKKKSMDDYIHRYHIHYELATSHFMLENDKEAYKSLNYCIQDQYMIKECLLLRGIILVESGNIEDGCKDLYDAENQEPGFATEEIKNYCLQNNL